MAKRSRPPEAKWCDDVVSLASRLRGDRKQVGEAVLASVFFRMAESRGLLKPSTSFEKGYEWLAACGGDPTMLPTLTPSFTEIPLDDEGKHHVELLGHLHGLLMAPEERRGRGSYYTPRGLAADIAAKTIEPLLHAPGPAESKDPPEKWKLKPAAGIAALKICDPAMGGGVFLVEVIRYLADKLHEALAREGKNLSVHDCRILVALRCIYGVDKDPTACWLAQSVVWLFLEEPTLSRYAFLHALRTGDALVGLDSEQLCAFHWDKGQPAIPEIVQHVTPRIHAAYELRKTFRTHRLTDDVALELNDEIDDALDDIRVIGNLCIGAFFDRDKPKARETERQQRLTRVLQWLRSGDELPDELDALQNAMTAKHVPFHWWTEFPEAFLWRDASLTPQPTEQPLVVSADARAVKAVQGAHGQMGWAL